MPQHSRWNLAVSLTSAANVPAGSNHHHDAFLGLVPVRERCAGGIQVLRHSFAVIDVQCVCPLQHHGRSRYLAARYYVQAIEPLTRLGLETGCRIDSLRVNIGATKSTMGIMRERREKSLRTVNTASRAIP